MAFCELTTRERVFVGANNAIALIPLANTLTNAVLDMTGVTEVLVCIGGVDASSDDAPSLISWEEVPVDGVDTWVISIQVGLMVGLPTGEQEMRVTVIDGDNPEGVVVTHDFPIDVIAPC